MWTIKTDSVTGMMKFRLTDDDEDVIASFRLNPADAKMISRLERACAEAEEMSASAPQMADAKDLEAYNDKLEKIACDALAVEHDAVFGIVSATTILVDGDLFAVNVLSTVTEVLGPEIAKRKAKMQQAASKYTANYQ